MRTDATFVLDVREFAEQHGVRKPIRLSARVPDVRAGLSDVPDEVLFDLVLEAIEGGILVRGTMSGEFTGECRRCLKPVRMPFELGASEVYRPAGEEWDEGYVIKDDRLDLEPMARDAIGLNLPASPLCRPDCAGLCARCGADLNEGPCGCPEEVIDLRWSALRELGRNLGGKPENR